MKAIIFLLCVTFFIQPIAAEEVLRAEVEVLSNGKKIRSSSIALAEGSEGTVGEAFTEPHRYRWNTGIRFDKKSKSLYNVRVEVSRFIKGKADFVWKPELMATLNKRTLVDLLPESKNTQPLQLAVTLSKPGPPAKIIGTKHRLSE